MILSDGVVILGVHCFSLQPEHQESLEASEQILVSCNGSPLPDVAVSIQRPQRQFALWQQLTHLIHQLHFQSLVVALGEPFHFIIVAQRWRSLLLHKTLMSYKSHRHIFWRSFLSVTAQGELLVDGTQLAGFRLKVLGDETGTHTHQFSQQVRRAPPWWHTVSPCFLCRHFSDNILSTYTTRPCFNFMRT